MNQSQLYGSRCSPLQSPLRYDDMEHVSYIDFKATFPISYPSSGQPTYPSSGQPRTFVDMDSGMIRDEMGQAHGYAPNSSMIVEPPTFLEAHFAPSSSMPEQSCPDSPSLLDAYNALCYREPPFDLDLSNILATLDDLDRSTTPPARLETPLAVNAPRTSRLLNFCLPDRTALDVIEYPLNSTQDDDESDEMNTTIEWECPVHTDYEFEHYCDCKEFMNMSMPDARTFKKMKRF
jgi:hypothetical protein